MNAEHLLDRARAVVGHRRGIYGAPDSVFERVRAVVDHALAGEPSASWRDAIAQVADRLLAARGSAGVSPESGP